MRDKLLVLVLFFGALGALAGEPLKAALVEVSPKVYRGVIIKNYGFLIGRWRTSYGTIEKRNWITREALEGGHGGTVFWVNPEGLELEDNARDEEDLGRQRLELAFLSDDNKRFPSQVVGFMEFRGLVYAVVQVKNNVEVYRSDHELVFEKRPIVRFAGAKVNYVDENFPRAMVLLSGESNLYRFLSFRHGYGCRLVGAPPLPPPSPMISPAN